MDKITIGDLNKTLGIETVLAAVRRSRLCWSGHVESQTRNGQNDVKQWMYRE